MLKKYIITVILAFVLVIPQLGYSAIMTYTDKGTFDAAAGAIDVEDFSDLVLNTGLTINLSVNGYIDTTNELLYDDLLRGIRETEFLFDNGITAFAGDIFDLEPGGVGAGIEFTVFYSGGGSEVLLCYANPIAIGL